MVRDGGLAALVRSGDHQDALGAAEPEVVAHHWVLNIAKLFGRQRQVERVFHVEALESGCHCRVAERQPRTAEPAHEGQIGQVEPDFAVERGDRRVDEIAVALTEVGQHREGVGVELGDTHYDLFFDMVHLGIALLAHVVVAAGVGAEAVEHRRHVGAVVDSRICRPARSP